MNTFIEKLEKLEALVNNAISFGITDANQIKRNIEKVTGLETTPVINGGGKYYYVLRESDVKHIVYIPNNVTLMRDSNTGYMSNFMTYFSGELMVCGGHELTNASDMFYKCSYHTIDLSYFDTSKIKDMSGMFQDNAYLKSINLSNFDTSNVNDMRRMFNGCVALQNIDLSSFNTSKVENMSGMFKNCGSLRKLDLSSFNTSKVEDMSRMFSGCRHLESLNVSRFDTSRVNDISEMFINCESLEELDLSSFNADFLDVDSDLFRNCKNLKTFKATDQYFINKYNLSRKYMDYRYH